MSNLTRDDVNRICVEMAERELSCNCGDPNCGRLHPLLDISKIANTFESWAWPLVEALQIGVLMKEHGATNQAWDEWEAQARAALEALKVSR